MNDTGKRSFKSHTKVILICISLIGVFLLSACESSFFSKSPDKSTTSEPVNNEKQIDSEKEAEAPSDTTEQNNIFNANVWPSLEELEESSEQPQKVNENVSDTKRMYSVSTVNVRSGPSTDYKKLGQLAANKNAGDWT
ncbi:MAG: SH3 domain-containing protein [Lachnospiraceae bacterium]|nr:SH3 domain-containing protein [Lachnospiraceae bacterium]